MPQYAPDPEHDNELDPGASTQLFQAFVDRYEPGGSSASRPGALVVVAAIVGLLVVLAIALILLM
jgi:hypothetical protein